MDPKIGEPGMIIRSYIFVLREMSCEFHIFIVPQKIRSAPFPETNSSHLKMDGWNMIFSFWDGLFSGAMLVPGRVHFRLYIKIYR